MMRQLCKNLVFALATLALAPLTTLAAPQEQRSPQSVQKCAESDSHDLAPYRYQLAAAYLIGQNGHQLPCELKCRGNENCQSTCQSDNGLRFLQKEMSRLLQSQGLQSCESISEICEEQCHERGAACKQACHLNS